MNTAITSAANSKKSLLLDRIVALKMQLAKLGCSNVVLTGGELALAPGILELARELSEDFSLTLLTNGTAWQPSDYVKLAELRLREMRVTLFSLEPRVHDAITGVAGSREKAWRFISAMREIGVPVKINIPVLRQNVSGVPALVKKLDAIGLKAFVEYKCFPGAHMENWRATAGQIMELIKSGVVPGLQKSLCGAIRHKLRIAPDGDIFPCEYLNEKIGNIFDAGAIASVRNSAEAKKILCAVDTDLADEKCGECAVKGHCFNCIAFNHAEHNNYSKPNEYFCELNKSQAQGKINA